MKIKGILASALIALSAFFLPTAASAQFVPVGGTFSFSKSFTAAGQGPIVGLNGQNTCVVTTSGGATGYTVTMKGTNNGTLFTLTQFGTSGAITADGAYIGSLIGSVTALGQITYAVTGTITGTLKVNLSCGSLSLSAISSAGQSQVQIFGSQTSAPVSSGGFGNADAQSSTPFSLLTAGELFGFNGTSWDRLRTTQPEASSTQPGILAVGICDNGPNGQCTRVASSNADGLANSYPGVIGLAFHYAYNGTGWDRLRTTQAFSGSNAGILAVDMCNVSGSTCGSVGNAGGSDGQSSVSGSVTVGDFHLLYNGATWDRERASPLATGLPASVRDSVGPTAPISCDQSAPVAVTGTSAVQLIAASGSTKIYVCGLLGTTNVANSTYQLEYGTGSNCGTGTTVLTGAMQMNSNAQVNWQNTVPFLRTPASQALCLVLTGTSPVFNGVIVYAQF